MKIAYEYSIEGFSNALTLTMNKVVDGERRAFTESEADSWAYKQTQRIANGRIDPDTKIKIITNITEAHRIIVTTRLPMRNREFTTA